MKFPEILRAKKIFGNLGIKNKPSICTDFYIGWISILWACTWEILEGCVIGSIWDLKFPEILKQNFAKQNEKICRRVRTLILQRIDFEHDFRLYHAFFFGALVSGG